MEEQLLPTAIIRGATVRAVVAVLPISLGVLHAALRLKEVEAVRYSREVPLLRTMAVPIRHHVPEVVAPVLRRVSVPIADEIKLHKCLG